MYVRDPIFHFNLARFEGFITWDGGTTATEHNITWSADNIYGKIGSYTPIFNGTTSYVDGTLSDGTHPILTSSNAVSIGGWFYFDVVNTNLVLFHLGSSLTSGIVILAINTDLRCVIDTYDSDYDDCTNVLSVGWHHIFVTCTNSKRLIYLDGEVINTANKTYDFTNLADSWNTGCFNGTSNFFKGRINAFYLTASCLSKKQILFLNYAPIYVVPLYNAVADDGLTDHSGSSRDPSAVGTFTLDTDTPRYNTALAFSGSASKYVYLGSRVRYLDTGFTLSIRFKTTTTNIEQVLIDNGVNGNYGIRLYIGTDNKIKAGYGTGSTIITIEGSELQTNTWYMATLTWDLNTIKLYLNGVIDTLLTCTTPPRSSSTSLYLTIGKTSLNCTNSSYAQAYPFYGSICDIRIYGAPINAANVYSLYSIPIQIDNEGTVWAYLFLETSSTSFSKRGIVSTETFTYTDKTTRQVSIKEDEIAALDFAHM